MIIKKTVFRPTTEKDLPGIFEVQSTAFGRTAEAKLCEQLIRHQTTTMSLCAELDGRLIGHVLFSELTAPLKALALAPLAVIPEFREMQIGSELVRQGAQAAADTGYDAVFVLGDPNYYERFGFSRGIAEPFEAEFSGPHFMAIALNGANNLPPGSIRYPEAFSQM